MNELYKNELKPKKVLLPLAQILMPFAPHLAEEIWEKLGGQGMVSLAQWPRYNPELVVDDLLTMAVQVNGKMRGTIQVQAETPENQALQSAMILSTVQAALGDKPIKKVIYKAGKILNLIN